MCSLPAWKAFEQISVTDLWQTPKCFFLRRTFPIPKARFLQSFVSPKTNNLLLERACHNSNAISISRVPFIHIFVAGRKPLHINNFKWGSEQALIQMSGLL